MMSDRRWEHWKAAVLCLLPLFIAVGCARLPYGAPVARQEAARVAERFRRWHEEGGRCRCCLEADVVITLRSVLRSGTVSGFLQAMSPSYLKVVGLNPLGQPVMILTTDGDRFSFVAVPEAKSYHGDVDADTFVKYAPEGFRPEEGFAWLTGRLPAGPLAVREVTANDEGVGYWLAVDRPGRPSSLVLFEPAAGTMLRRIDLDDRGEMVIDVRYADHLAVGEGGCWLPGRLTVTSRRHNASLEVVLSKPETDLALKPADFTLAIPPGFAEITVD